MEAMKLVCLCMYQILTIVFIFKFNRRKKGPDVEKEVLQAEVEADINAQKVEARAAKRAAKAEGSNVNKSSLIKEQECLRCVRIN